MDDKEMWIPMRKFEDIYEISTWGNIRNIHHNIGRLMGGTVLHNGYRIVTLWKNEKKKWYKISPLVAQHFLPNPEKLPTVDHINRIRTDDRVSNLRWASYITQSRNRQVRKNKMSSNLIGVYESNCERRMKQGENKERAQSYRARIGIKIDGKRKIIHLGTYKTEKEAGIARDVVTLLRDQNACLNFPEEVKTLFPIVAKFFLNKRTS